MKVDVLGTEYKIIMNAKAIDCPKLKGLNGYIDWSSKEIVIAKIIEENDTVSDTEKCIRKTLRHEIIHAFIYESGLHANSDWACNEELVDWIALQFEKMLYAFIKVNAIDES